MKKMISLTMAMLLVLTVFGCLSLAVAENAETGKTEPKRFGIIGAMDEEIASLTEAMTEPHVRAIAGMDFYEGTLDGADVVIVKCGVGKVNAASCAQILIDVFEVDRIINTGVAGSLDARIDIGDIVVSTEAVQHDMDATPLGFARGEIPYSDTSVFPADEAMRKRTVEAVGAVAPEIHVFEGRVCSGDQFIASHAQKEAIISDFGGMCCEMEGAAIAQVCHLNGTPFVIIRAISDKADDSEEMSYIEFEQAAAERCAAITRYMIAHYGRDR
ncbi:MAG: 5'-methylthioadenosine/adenosylhomocysteine nucleosidase [Eubacteriales bacterium]|nr:5'-methylthioadenosine/adenosylhomocysteine nucleosidase [Eubacteriales bacterium]